MADSILFVGWDEPARGREQRAVEAFNDHVGFYGRCQQEGRIESFDACFLEPTGNGLQGFFLIRGTLDQINALRDDDEFLRLHTEAATCVDGLTRIAGATGERLARMMGIYQEATAKVAQTA